MAIFFLVAGLTCIGISLFLFNQSRAEATPAQPVKTEKGRAILKPLSEETNKVFDEAFESMESKPNKNETVKKDEDIWKEKGNAFEDFIIQKIGKVKGVKLIGKNSDYHKNGVSAEENKEPDLKFSYYNKPFAVECKWRSAFFDSQVIWAKDYQVTNYNKFAETTKQNIFIAIGVGGEPENPDRLFLVPLYRLTKEFATEKHIKEYEFADSKRMMEIINKD